MNFPKNRQNFNYLPSAVGNQETMHNFDERFPEDSWNHHEKSFSSSFPFSSTSRGNYECKKTNPTMRNSARNFVYNTGNRNPHQFASNIQDNKMDLESVFNFIPNSSNWEIQTSSDTHQHNTQSVVTNEYFVNGNKRLEESSNKNSSAEKEEDLQFAWMKSTKSHHFEWKAEWQQGNMISH